MVWTQRATILGPPGVAGPPGAQGPPGPPGDPGPPGPGTTPEDVQDSIGAILQDTATVDLTYTDATPSITADVRAASITETHLAFSDVTADNATTGQHGLLPKLSGTATHYLDGSGAWSTPAGSGGGAPTGAQYLVGATDPTLTAERVVTNTPTLTWDLATAGQAQAHVPNDAITYAKLQNVTDARLLGRSAGSAGDCQELTVGTGLTLSGGVLTNAQTAFTAEDAQDAVGAMLVDTATIDLTYTDATPSLTAAVVAGSIGTTQLTNSNVTYAKIQNISATDRLLGRSTAGAGVVEEIVCTPLARSLLDDTTQAAMQTTLGVPASTAVQPLDATLTALAGLATGANQLAYSTGSDTFAQTPLTAAGRALLDDADTAAQRTTLGLGTAAQTSYDTGTFTITATGFGGTAPSGTARYTKVGTQATVALPDLTGTSNATTFTLTGLPALLTAVSIHRAIAVVESGAGSYQYGTIVVSGVALTVQLGAANTPWTASGVKSVFAVHLTYLTT